MKRALISGLALSLISSVAVAQEAPKYIPWEVDHQSAQALESALGEIPAKYSLPIINFVQRQEQIAQQRAEMKRERDANKSAHVPPVPEKAKP
jgi:hypothetical protein